MACRAFVTSFGTQSKGQSSIIIISSRGFFLSQFNQKSKSIITLQFFAVASFPSSSSSLPLKKIDFKSRMDHLPRSPDALELLEFKSRQQLLEEDRIMRDKINNYVQLVAALTGEEVMLPMDDDEFTFVSVSSGHESLASDYDEEEVGPDFEYVLDEDEWEYESVGSNEGDGDADYDKVGHTTSSCSSSSTSSRLGALDSIEEGPDDVSPIPPPPPPPPPKQNSKIVDETAPPTPSQIIRKLKVTLVQAGMEQRRLKKKKSRRLDGGNWSYDMARRRLKRELNRVQMRKAYRDAIRTLPPLARSISEEKLEDLKPSSEEDGTKEATATQSTTNKPSSSSSSSEGNNTNTNNNSQLPSAAASGSVFVNLLKTLEQTRKPTGGSAASSSTTARVKMSRSDERLQAILQKHHHNLMNKKEKMNMSNSSFPEAPPFTTTADGSDSNKDG